MKIFNVVVMFFSLIIAQSCGTVKPLSETFWVSGTKTECDAGAGKSMCLKISKEEKLDDATWQNFYAPIEGFEFKQGIYQKIEVSVKELDKSSIPADASSLKYTLNQVLETKPDETVQLNNTWTLVRLNNASLNRMVAVPTMTIDLSKNSISGNTGCNNYSATVKNINTKGIDLSIPRMTKKACINKNVETEYGKALTNIVTYTLTEKELVFNNVSGEEVLAFIKNDTNTANQTIHDIWVAATIDGNPINRMVAAPRLEVNLTKMQVMGNDGCNNFTGEIKSINASKITLGNMAVTQKACRNMEVSDRFNKALTKVNNYKVDSGTLIFTDNEGKEILKLIKTD